MSGKSKAVVMLRLAALRNDVAALPNDPTGQTVSAVCKQWLTSLDVSPGTRASYEYALKHVGDLKDVPFHKLTPLLIEQWMLGLRGTAEKPTCQKAGNALRSVCEYAASLGLIRISPFKSKIPTAKPKDVDPFSISEVKEILHRARAKRGAIVVELSFLCAMRQGECLGLQWQDIDWKASTLSIRRQTVESKGGLRVCKPKTKSSIRTIRLSTMAVEALHRRRVEALKEGVAGPADFVLTAPKSNKPMRRSNFSHRVWNPILSGAQPKVRGKRKQPDDLETIRHRGLHHARHTSASLMLQRRVPLPEVSAYLGHANPTITLRLYSHAMPGSGELAASSMNDALTSSASAVTTSVFEASEAS